MLQKVGFLFKRKSYSLKMFSLLQIDIPPLENNRDNLLLPYNQELQHITKVPTWFFCWISSVWLTKRWEMNSKIFCKKTNSLIQGHSTEPYSHRSEKEPESHRNCLGKYSLFYTLCMLWKTPSILLFLHKHQMAKKIYHFLCFPGP